MQQEHMLMLMDVIMLFHQILKSLLYVYGVHRLVFNTGMVAKENREQTINEALSQVEVPTEEWSNR